MQTATEAVTPSTSSPEPSKRSGTSLVHRLIGGIPADAVWAGMLISAGCYWAGYSASDALILLYGMWMLWNRNQYGQRWFGLLVFTGIGFIAAHRFDLDKMVDWLPGNLLPLMIILACQWLHGTRQLQSVNRVIGRLFVRAKLHWIPYAILAASCTVLLCGLKWSVYGGSLLLILLLVAVRQERRLAGGLLMALIYDLAVHLFIMKGALFIREGLTMEFMEAHWGTLLVPILAVAGAALKRPSLSALPPERMEEEPAK